MHLRSVLVKFEDGGPRPIFLGHGVRFQHILVALGLNLYHGCISGVSWLSSKMDDLDLFFEVMGVNFNIQICNFRL